MFVDYLTIMLINLTVGLVILALFVFRFIEKDGRKVAPGLLLTGALSAITGFAIIFTWPIPGSYNIPFGDMATLFGLLLFFAGLAILKDWDFLTIVIYAVFAGAAAIVLGFRILNLKITNEPLVSAAGFVVTGVGAILTFPVYFLKKSMVLRVITALALLGGAVIWAVFGYAAYWQHLANFSKWLPPTMIPAPAK